MFPTSYIEISEAAVKNNIDFINKTLGKGVAFSSVVKGNAYGHGISNYCPLAYKYGVKHFSVFSAHEALKLINSMPHQDYTTMIMGHIGNEELEWAIENDVEFYISERNRLESAIEVGKKLGKQAKIHLELETGMNRTGFDSKEGNLMLKMIQSEKTSIELKGICTHLAGAESIANYKRIDDQRKRFKRIANKIKNYDWLSPKWHMASSAASIRYPDTRLDMARVGILQYGFFPTQEILVYYLTKAKKVISPLQRVISWKTRVMEVKTVKPGSFIGYGNSYFTNETTKIALLPVGYANGYSRSLSNYGKVLIRGKRLEVIGTVNMSMLAVNVTEIGNVEKGDEAVLIGNQGEGEITVSSFSDFSNLLNYELLTRLPQDIPRIISK